MVRSLVPQSFIWIRLISLWCPVERDLRTRNLSHHSLESLYSVIREIMARRPEIPHIINPYQDLDPTKGRGLDVWLVVGLIALAIIALMSWN